MDESASTPAFKARVLSVLVRIPEGRVMTYGSLAVAAGKPGNARQVGDLLRGLSSATDFPWQRVINSQGRISTYKVGTGELQRALLESEGIAFNSSGRCNLSRLNWFPGDDEATEPH
jgi:methylated-DNA-protein-cysteine methyltransferase related protein